MSTAFEHYKRGHRLYGENRFDEAIAAYREALAVRPDWSDCMQALGMAQMHKGELDAALAGQLDAGKVEHEAHPIFNLKVPKSCPGVPAEILNPRNTWQDKAAYDAQATKLRDMFRKNFEEKGFAKLGIKAVM